MLALEILGFCGNSQGMDSAFTTNDPCPTAAVGVRDVQP